jgi:hypothetical protein
LILATAATGYKDGHQILLKLLYMKSIDKLAWIELQNKSILSTKVLKDKFYIPEEKENDETDANL